MNHFKKIKLFINELSNTPATLDKIAELSLEYFGDNILTNNLTYQQFYAEAYEISLILKTKYKIKSAVSIVIDLESSLTYMKMFWAVIMSGARPILMNYAFDQKTKKQLIKSVRPKLIIDQVLANQLLKLLKITSKEINFNANWSDSFAYFTSGTTSLPKLITHSGEIVKRQIMCSKYVLKVSPDISLNGHVEDIRLLMLLPLYHIFGLLVNMFWFGSLGIRLIFPESLSFDEIKSKCLAHKVTHIFAPPLLWNSLAQQIVDKAKLTGRYADLIKGVKLSNHLQQRLPFVGKTFARNKFKPLRAQLFGDLKFIISGGGFIEKETLNILNGIGYKVHNGYGLSEAGIIAVDLNCRINDDPTYVGRVFPLIRTSVDADMNLFVDTFVRKQNNFIFKPFLTNDIATFHNQKLHIIGRKDDIIIGANGENISPNIVEAYFKPLNTPVAAVGVKQHALSDRLVLFIEGNKDLSMTIKEIVNQMPLLYKPREFFLVKKIPLNPLNKVKYFELSDLYTKHYTSLKSINSKHSYHKEKINKDTALIAGEICDYYKVIFPSPIKPIDIYTDIFYDLGASSLDYFMLLAKISTDFKVDIHFQNMTNFKTPLDFAKLIKTKIKQPKS